MSDAQEGVVVTQGDRVRVVSERILSRMRDWAKPMGWAVAVHGSMTRDLDVIAVPWIDDASDETAFVDAMRASVASELRGRCFVTERQGKPWPGEPCEKPHGRRSWTLHAISDDLVVSDMGAHPYVDLCVMDFRTEATRQAVEALRKTHGLLMTIEQRSYDNCWWVKADDPETAVGDVYEAVCDALSILGVDPSPPPALAGERA